MATEPLQAMSEMLDHELADLAGRVDRDALACLFGQETGQEAAADLLGQFTELYPEAAGRADTDDRDSLVGLLNLLEALNDGDRIDWFARLATRDHPDESDALRPLAHARLSVTDPGLPAVAWRAAVWRHGRACLAGLRQDSPGRATAGARLWLSGLRQPRHRQLLDALAERVEPDEAPLAALVAGGLASEVTAERVLSAGEADGIVAEVRRIADGGHQPG